MNWLKSISRTLGTRLVGMFLILTFLLAGGTSYLIHDLASDALHASAENRLTNINLLKEAELERWIVSNMEQLEALAQRPLVREYSAEIIDLDRTDTRFQELRDQLLQDHLIPTLKTNGGYEVVSLINAENGKIILSTREDLEGKFRESKQFFLEGLSGTHFAKPEYDQESNQPVQHVSTPVRDAGGKVIAVLVGHVDVDEISVIMVQDREFTQTQESYLIDSSNLMITENRLSPTSAHKAFVFTTAAENCLQGENGSAMYDNYRGEPVVGSYRWIPEWEMCLITEQDQSEAFILLANLTEATILIGVGILILGTITGFLFSRSITRPLKALTRGALEVGQGNLDYEVIVNSRDELGDLADSFNHMRESLSGSISENVRMLQELELFNDELEARVADRTRELKEAQLTAQNLMEEAQQARKKSEENEFRFRALFEDSPVSLWEEDFSALKEYLVQLKEQGIEDFDAYFTENTGEVSNCFQLVRVLEVNQQSLTTFEAKDKNQLLESMGNTFTAETENILRQELITLAGGKLRFGAEIPYLTLKGNQIWGSLVVSIAPGFEETWSKVLVSILDITDQKKAREAILEEKDFSDKIINSIPGIFYVINTEGRFLRWNRNFVNVSEYSDKELRSLKPVALFTGAERELIAKKIGESFARGASSVTAHITSKSGKKTPYFLTGIRVMIEGDPILVGTGMDISERVYAEKALAEKARDLKRSNKDLEQFAYVASHDLQEPLRMVASYLQLLDKRYSDDLTDEAREFMAFAVDGATRMKQLINDLLAYSRVGTKGEEFHLIDFDQVLEKVNQNIEELVSDSGAAITHDDLPTLKADPTQILQLYQNLISNAIKFRKMDESPVIHLSAELENGYWKLGVHDNGIGLDLQYAERIFVLFQRLHGSEQYPGTGIGLALSKRIVERHGGKIWVESRPGEGATFYFTLPD
jgi:PAS domain S-box-containing protein